MFFTLLDLLALPWRSSREKDLEILLLRHQLAILPRAQPRPVRPTRWEKRMLAAKLVTLGGGARSQLNACLLLFTAYPESRNYGKVEITVE
jgi:hypothetical protein